MAKHSVVKNFYRKDNQKASAEVTASTQTHNKRLLLLSATIITCGRPGTDALRLARRSGYLYDSTAVQLGKQIDV